PELRAWLVVLPDGAARGSSKLVGPRDDGLEHRLEIEGRAQSATDVAQGGQLLDRMGELRRARFQLLEQANVLDGDDRLIREGLHELDLAIGELLAPLPAHRDGAHGMAIAEDRHAHEVP